MEFAPFKNIPKDIYATPNITLIFILKEFKNIKSFSAIPHTGSTPFILKKIPKGYTQSFYFLSSA
jgi:hypothetical protein